MKILILPRVTEDWDNLDTQEYYKKWNDGRDGIDTYQQHGALAWNDWDKHDFNLRFNLDLWNKKRKLPFVKYRAEIKRIARKTWKKANLEIARVVSGWPPDYFGERSDDIILIPIDDDDWIAPTIKEELLQAFSDPKISLVIWDSWMLDTINNKWEYNVPTINSMIWSCAYAVRSSMSNAEIEHNHMLMDQFKHTVPYIFLHKPLSIYQAHPGSTCGMRIYPFEFKTKRIPHPPDLSWGHEEKEDLYKLNLKINPHKIF